MEADMKHVWMKTLFVLTAWMPCVHGAASMAADHELAQVLLDVTRQLHLRPLGEPTRFSLFGMPSAFVVLDIKDQIKSFMQQLHGLTAPFSRFTRVGKQIFYSGERSGAHLQLVIDLAHVRDSQVLLSAVKLAPDTRAGIDPSAWAPTRPRYLPLLPAGGRLLMDICYADEQRRCHQIYLYPQREKKQLANALEAELIAANWVRQPAGGGFSSWVRHGRKLQYFLDRSNVDTALYLTAPDELW